jgi:serine/threonine-protein kinase
MTVPREGDLFDGKYRIGSVLGTGAMAAVIAARHLGFDQMVALKILLPELCDDPEMVARFVEEGRTAIRIRSEHVVRMLDVGVFAGRAYLVMEHLEGNDLEAVLQMDGPLPFTTAVDLILQACEAIGEAHALGIVHRDLKPANLFLTRRLDGSACLKVLDFGISKMPRPDPAAARSGSHPTLRSMVMGSPHYMSPEQIASGAADGRADIWSLGAILYELLTGHLAFGGSTTSEVYARVFQGTPVPMVRLRSDVPDEVAIAVSRCLERDLPRRWRSVADLARALAPFGTASARASADSIARVLEGGIEGRGFEEGSMRAIAAPIVAPTRARRRKTSGYLVGTLAALTFLGAIAGARVLRHGSVRAAWPIALGAMFAPPPVLALPVPPPLSPADEASPVPLPVLAPPLPSAAPAAPPAPRPAPAKPHHRATVKAHAAPPLQ